VIPPPDQVAREVLALRGVSVREEFGASVRQLFAVTDHGTPDPVGSCVLFSVGGRHFVLTASHVLNHNIESSLYVGGLTDLVLLEGETQRTEAKNSPPVDSFDIAVVELGPELVNSLGNVKFLTSSDLDPNDVADGRQIYVALGFPWRKTAKDLSARRVRSPMMSVTALSDADLFETLDVPEHTHVVIPFDRNNMMKDGQRQTAPKPEGMSGGGLFRSDHLAAYADGNPVAKLVGILTQYRDSGITHMKATRIWILLEAIRFACPELDALLPRATRASVTFKTPRSG
jgi:hypothetical protein